MLLKQDSEIYHYELKDFELKFFSGELSLHQVRIVPKTRYLDSLKSLNKAKPTIYSIEIESISIKDLNPIRILFSRKIKIGSVRLESPTIELYKADSSIAEKGVIISQIGNQKQLFSDLIEGKFKSVRINEIKVERARTKVYRIHQSDTTLLMQAKRSNFMIYGIFTDQEVIRSNTVFNYDSTSFDLREAYWDGLQDYQIYLGQFKKTTDNDHLIINDLKLSPREDKFSFMRNQKEETDWFKCEIEKIIVLNFDIEAFHRNRSVNSSKVHILGGNIEIYRDKRLRDQKNEKQLIGTILKELEFDLGIDKVELYGSSLNYYEWEANAKKPIHAKIEEVSLTIENLTNKFQNMIQSDTLKLRADGKFMNKGQLELKTEFLLSDTNDRFNVYLRIEDVPLPLLNPILKESAFIEFQDGKLDWIEMKMIANDFSSKSSMDMQYSNMKHFDLLRGMNEVKIHKEKGHHVSRKRKFLSFIIREVIPNDYGPKSPNYQTSYYTVERNRQKSMVNYLVENLKTGAKSHLKPDFLKKD